MKTTKQQRDNAKRWKKANKEKVAEHQRRYYEKNKESIKEYKQQWWEENKDSQYEKQKAYKAKVKSDSPPKENISRAERDPKYKAYLERQALVEKRKAKKEANNGI